GIRDLRGVRGRAMNEVDEERLCGQAGGLLGDRPDGVRRVGPATRAPEHVECLTVTLIVVVRVDRPLPVHVQRAGEAELVVAAGAGGEAPRGRGGWEARVAVEAVERRADSGR